MDTKLQKDSPTRIEPQSSEAEKAVLGSMLISKEAIPRAMSFLTEREQMILKLRFGFDDGRPRTSKND